MPLQHEFHIISISIQHRPNFQGFCKGGNKYNELIIIIITCEFHDIFIRFVQMLSNHISMYVQYFKEL